MSFTRASARTPWTPWPSHTSLQREKSPSDPSSTSLRCFLSSIHSSSIHIIYSSFIILSSIHYSSSSIHSLFIIIHPFINHLSFIIIHPFINNTNITTTQISPTDMFQNYGKKYDFIKMFVRRVFITDNFEDMLPKYLSFLRGVVSCGSV